MKNQEQSKMKSIDREERENTERKIWNKEEKSKESEGEKGKKKRVRKKKKR